MTRTPLRLDQRGVLRSRPYSRCAVSRPPLGRASARARTCSPAAASSSATVPSNGACSASSIFIASRTPSISPARTVAADLAVTDEDRPRHRRGHRAVGRRGRRVVEELLGPAEDVGAAAVADRHGVRRALDEELVQRAVDLEAERVGRRPPRWGGRRSAARRPRRRRRHGRPAARGARRRRARPRPARAGRRRASRRRPRTGRAVDRGRRRLRPRGRAAARGRARAPSTASGVRSSQAVSMVASRNSSEATSARRKPTLVVSPRIAVSSSAATSARRAASRSRRGR